ncbi:MAG: OmpA family protein [Caulobacteraceae bacterium]
MTIPHHRAAAFGLAAMAALSMAACASRPKPMGPAATLVPAPPPPPSYAAPSPGPVTEGPVSGAAVPGSERDFVINAGDRVYFAFDSYQIRDDARPVLAAQVAWLGRYPAVRVRIEGNCDERGTRDYNFALGARRADAVRDWLVARGVDGARISTVSFGKEHPIDTSGSDDGAARNRNAHTAITQGAT